MPDFDIRDAIQEEATELAFRQYEADFYDLTKEQQAMLYSRAMEKITGEMMSLGSDELKRRREQGEIWPKPAV